MGEEARERAAEGGRRRRRRRGWWKEEEVGNEEGGGGGEVVHGEKPRRNYRPTMVLTSGDPIDGRKLGPSFGKNRGAKEERSLG